MIDEMKCNEKGVIFSQWTSFLDLVGDTLTIKGISFCCNVASMSAEERLEFMRLLDTDDGPSFWLASLHCAGVGITLTQAYVSFILEFEHFAHLRFCQG
jgi:SNF2 family DNA or RNA helicase